MSRKFTLEEMKPMLGNDAIELSESIKVHWIGHHHDFDFEIKFISKRGVGFPERMCGGASLLISSPLRRFILPLMLSNIESLMYLYAPASPPPMTTRPSLN